MQDILKILEMWKQLLNTKDMGECITFLNAKTALACEPNTTEI